MPPPFCHLFPVAETLRGQNKKLLQSREKLKKALRGKVQNGVTLFTLHFSLCTGNLHFSLQASWVSGSDPHYMDASATGGPCRSARPSSRPSTRRPTSPGATACSSCFPCRCCAIPPIPPSDRLTSTVSKRIVGQMRCPDHSLAVAAGQLLAVVVGKEDHDVERSVRRQSGGTRAVDKPQNQRKSRQRDGLLAASTWRSFLPLPPGCRSGFVRGVCRFAPLPLTSKAFRGGRSRDARERRFSCRQAPAADILLREGRN